MRYASFLKNNGIIGFVAPSFGAATEPYYSAFEAAQNRFRQMGYQLFIGSNCYEGCGIGISNTPKKCAKELTEAYCDPVCDVLISCGGGEMMCEDLEFIDFARIREASPKWYMGYSDNTNFTFLLTTLCDTASIYGPCVKPFGMKEWDASLYDAMDLLCGRKLTQKGYESWQIEDWPEDQKTPYSSYHKTIPRKLRCFIPDGETLAEASNEVVHLQGRMLGGCLDCLKTLVGTEFDRVSDFVEKYKEDGILWFLESCDLNVFDIRRAMWQLEHAGWFRYTRGFLIGRPMHFDEPMMGLDQYHAVIDIVSHYQVPVIMDLDLGHLPPMMPVICGSVGEVNLRQQDFSLDMRLI